MALELHNVCKRFPGVLAVDNVSFSAPAGEITGYLGPNGSGKSTTMKMIAGLIETGSGEILFDGEPIRRDLIAHKQRMGYVPEEPYLYAHLSGLEYLTMVTQLRGLPEKRTAKRIDGLLLLLSLHADRHSPISAYSKGMRQKILLAGALLHDPDLLLLDEPFASLDALTRLQMQDLVVRLVAVHRPAALLVTHDPDEALCLADRILILRSGSFALDLRITASRQHDRNDAEFLRTRRLLLETLGVLPPAVGR